MISKFVFSLMLIFSFSLHSQASEDEDIFLFRKAIQEQKFDLAESIFRKLVNEGLSIPNLELLETEMWIEKGEHLYKNKQFKSAFPYFRDAYLRWRTNQLVNERYKELNSKVLTDESAENKPRQEVYRNSATSKIDYVPLINSINSSNQILASYKEDLAGINIILENIVRLFSITLYLIIANLFLISILIFKKIIR